jgi:hypothetical protein
MPSISGPLLEQLTRRLTETPPEMLADPAIGISAGKNAGEKAGVEAGAVAGDVLRGLGMRQPDARWLLSLHPDKADKGARNRLRVTLVASWLLADPWFRGKADAVRAQEWLREGLSELAALATADAFVKDDDRREELARLCLRALQFTVPGETEAQAQDRLESISSIERNRVIAASRAAHALARKRRAEEEARARKVQEEMQRKANEAAAAKGSRE